jgi:hypothetical protein
MFFLYGFSFIYIIVYCFIKYNNYINRNKYINFDNNNNENDYNWDLLNIEIYDNNYNFIETKEINEYNYKEQEVIDIKKIFSDNILLDHYNLFYVINYLYNDNKYKLLIKDSSFIFPLYKKSEINNYIFINEIVKIIVNNNYSYTDILKQFLGPNYNFYSDLDLNPYIYDLLKINNINIDISDSNIYFVDKFDIKQMIQDYNSKINWKPTIY